MYAEVGDRVVIRSPHVGEPVRDGEILAVRAGRPGGRLKDAKRRIHAQADAPAPA